jgi:hypothetical protein
MNAPRPITLVVAATVAAIGAGCSGGGGGGAAGMTSGASGVGASAGGTATGASTPFTGTDTTPPSYTIVAPARGGHVSGGSSTNIEGTATDTESGVQKVEINGQLATLAGSQWTIPATLATGTNTFTIRVTDNQGNVAHSSWSAVYSPGYLPANQAVPHCAAVRLSQNAVTRLVPVAMQTITQQGLLQGALANLGSLGGGIASVSNLTFGNPTVQATLVQGGVRAVIDVPNLDAQITLSGTPMYIGADNVRIDATLMISAQSGVFAVSMPSTPSVAFTNFRGPGGATLAPVFEAAVATAMQSALPGALQSALNGAAVAPRSFTYGPFTATVDARPNSLAIDGSNLRASGDANVSLVGTGPLAGTPRTAPGSFSRAGGLGAPPNFTTPHDVSLAIREDLVNRALFAAWQSGAGRVRIDQAFVNQALAQLPFPIPFQVSLDISFLVPFFPALSTLNPSGGPMPIAFELDPVLPPIVTVQGAPSLLAASVGELQLKILVDLGSGFQDLLVLALHGQLGLSAQLQNGVSQLKLTIGQPVQLNASLLQNPLGLNAPDVDRFINTALPLVVQLAGGMIPPIPLPPVPGGLAPRNVDMFQDGQNGDFLTIEGDL